MHAQYILALQKLQQNSTQAKDISFRNTHLTWGVCELIEKNFSMHVRTTAGVFFTTACTATPPRHAHRASVATYMQQHQQQQQQAALYAMVHAKKICQHAGSCITCTVCTYREAGFIIIIINQHLTCTQRRRRRRHARVSWTGGKKKVHITNVTTPLPTDYLTPIFPSCSKTTTDEQMMAKMSWLACIHAFTPRR